MRRRRCVATKPNVSGDAARLRELETVAQDAERASISAKAEDARTRGDLFGQLGAFADRHDPRTLMAEMDDGTPLLLFPLRVETRFKQTGQSIRALGARVSRRMPRRVVR